MEKTLSENSDLEVLAGEWLRKRGALLAVAESCTGGLIGHLVTNVPGSSEYFLGSVVAYAYEVKENILGVSRETLDTYGAVSQETALEMARGARKVLTHGFAPERVIGMATTGIAGPGGGMPGKPVGLVWIGLSTFRGDWSWKYTWKGDRLENKIETARKALELLVDYLKNDGA
jgi:PncC family amidohydrolase